jgi:hypothetical protein
MKLVCDEPDGNASEDQSAVKVMLALTTQMFFGAP